MARGETGQLFCSNNGSDGGTRRTAVRLAYLVDAAFAPSGNWRWMFGFGLLPALALGFGIAVVPESPRWLLLHQHKEAALKVLSRIRPTAEIMAEVNDILELLLDRMGRRPLLLVSELGRDVFVPRSGIRGRRSSVEMDRSA